MLVTKLSEKGLDTLGFVLRCISACSRCCMRYAQFGFRPSYFWLNLVKLKTAAILKIIFLAVNYLSSTHWHTNCQPNQSIFFNLMILLPKSTYFYDDHIEKWQKTIMLSNTSRDRSVPIFSPIIASFLSIVVYTENHLHYNHVEKWQRDNLDYKLLSSVPWNLRVPILRRIRSAS